MVPPAGQLDLLGGPPAPAATAPPGDRALPVLDQRQRGTTFLALPVRSVLNPPAATGMGFWSLNPYIGCEFGCSYCYARDTHRWTLERLQGPAAANVDTGLAFERRILVKTAAPELLAGTLDPARLAGQTLVIGTATDPYQPAERRFLLTQRVLQQLLAYRGLTLGLITKSPLVVRDLALWQQLAARHDVSINISLASLEAPLVRRLEPRSPVPSARLRALTTLTRGGIHAGLLIAPILPGLTDSRAALAALMQAGREAGARYVVGMALRLNAATRARFLPFFEREFPDLAVRYRRHYGSRANAARDYTEALARRLRTLQRHYGFPVSESRRRQRQLAGGAAADPAARPLQGVLL